MNHPTLGAIDDHMVTLAREDAPDFENKTGRRRIHDWRNYVGEHVAAMWAKLPLDVRFAISLDAQALADKEDWE